jgi:hypothetical protein
LAMDRNRALEECDVELGMEVLNMFRFRHNLRSTGKMVKEISHLP